MAIRTRRTSARSSALSSTKERSGTTTRSNAAIANADVAALGSAPIEDRSIVVPGRRFGDAGCVGVVNVDQPRAAEHELLGEAERRWTEECDPPALGELLAVHAENQRR